MFPGFTEVSVAKGDQVAAGAPFFAQDETADRAARDQATRLLRQAQEQLGNLESAGKPTEDGIGRKRAATMKRSGSIVNIRGTPACLGGALEALLLDVTDPRDPLADVARRLAGHTRVVSTGTFLDMLPFPL